MSLPLGICHLKNRPLFWDWPFWIMFPNEWVVRNRIVIAKSRVPGLIRPSFTNTSRSGLAGGSLGRTNGHRNPVAPSALRQVETASRTGTNLACASASSDSGSELATIPQPANSRTVEPLTSAERSAMPHSPSPVASIQPTGPA